MQKFIYKILDTERFLRDHWLDILTIALQILTVILLILEFLGIIKL